MTDYKETPAYACIAEAEQWIGKEKAGEYEGRLAKEVDCYFSGIDWLFNAERTGAILMAVNQPDQNRHTSRLMAWTRLQHVAGLVASLSALADIAYFTQPMTGTDAETEAQAERECKERFWVSVLDEILPGVE